MLLSPNHAPALGFRRWCRPVAALRRVLRAGAAALIALATGGAPARSAGPVAVPVDGPPFEAALVSADAEWRFVFDTGSERRALEAAELVRWGDMTEPPSGPILILADGGLVVADVFEADKDSLKADSLLLGAIRLPIEALAGIVFQFPSQRRARDALVDRVLGAEGNQDLAILDNGDQLAGVFEGIEDDTMDFRGAPGPTRIETHRLAAISFNPSLRRKVAAEGPRAWVGWSDGTRLLVSRLETQGAAARFTPPAVDSPWTARWSELRGVQVLGGRVVYLSDLEPAEYRHVPFLDLAWPYRRDRNVEGGWLRAGGRLYLKGLGMHSAARLSYALDGRARHFEAEAAIDDSTGGRGSARFRVFVDGREVATRKVVRGGDRPAPIAVPLAGAKRLDLVVDFAERADQLDRADWLDARVIR